MAKYERKKRTGWVFHHENVAMIEVMEAEDCKAIIIALTKYSRDLAEEGFAVLDVSGVPSAMGKAFCRMATERIDQEADSFVQKCNQNQKNREKGSTTVDDGQRPSTTVCDGQRPSDLVDQAPINKEIKKRNKEIEEVEHASAPIIGFDGTDLTQEMENCARADDLVQRYKLPDTDQSREALLEDAARVGFDRLEGALKQAALSNNRQGLSVNFYRSVLNSNEKRKGASSFEGLYGQM